MKVTGWILLGLGGGLLFIMSPPIAAGVAMVLLGAVLLGG